MATLNATAALAGSGGFRVNFPAELPALCTKAQNAIIDAFLRGQALVTPATWYVALVTAAGSPTVAGTEVAGGSYARVSVTASLANFCGTQGLGTTVASSGTNGITKNNAGITFAAPTADWGTIVGWELWDALTAGNRWLAGSMLNGITITNGGPARSFGIGALTIHLR